MTTVRAELRKWTKLKQDAIRAAKTSTKSGWMEKKKTVDKLTEIYSNFLQSLYFSKIKNYV